MANVKGTQVGEPRSAKLKVTGVPIFDLTISGMSVVPLDEDGGITAPYLTMIVTALTRSHEKDRKGRGVAVTGWAWITADTAYRELLDGTGIVVRFGNGRSAWRVDSQRLPDLRVAAGLFARIRRVGDHLNRVLAGGPGSDLGYEWTNA